MITLRDGSKELSLGKDKRSIEVGEISNLVDVVNTARAAVIAGELDQVLETQIKSSTKKTETQKK